MPQTSDHLDHIEWFQVFLLSITVMSVGFAAFALRNTALRRQIAGQAEELATSEKAQTLARLRDSEDRFRSFVDVAADFYFEVDENLAYTFMSEGLTTLRGLSTDSFIGKAHAEMMGDHVMKHDTQRQFVALLDRREVIKNLLMCRELKDGGNVWSRVSAQPFFDDDGNFAGYRGVSSDATAEVRIEEALREAEARFRELAEGSTQGLLVTDAAPNLLFANDRAAAIFGYDSVEELRALPSLVHLMDPEERERMPARRQRLLESGGTPLSEEVKGIRKDGSTVWVEDIRRRIDWDGVPAVQITFTDITERKRASQALQENESRFRSYVDIASDWYFELNKNLVYTFVSKGIFEARGIAPDTYIGKTHKEVMGPYAAHKTQQEFIDRTERHEAIRGLLLCREMDDGNHLWARVNAQPIFDDDGTFAGYLGVTSDVTDQVRAEETRKEAEAQLDAFFAHAPVGLAIYDDQRRFLKVNDTLAEWNDLPPEDHIGKRMDEILPALAPSHQSTLDHIFETGQTRHDLEFSTRLPGKPDEERSWLINRFPIPGASGEVENTGTVAVEVTEQKLVEQALIDSENQLRLVLDNLPALIVYIDTDQRYRLVNQTCADWYGMAKSEIIGRKVEEIHNEQYDKFSPHIDRALAGETLSFEGKVQYPNGDPRFINSIHVPDIDPSGKVLGYVSLTEDITERKRIEAEIKQLNVGLEQQVEDRTAELKAAYTEILQNERLATLGQLTATVSHELRNPLGVLRSSVYVLQNLVPKGDDKLDQIINRVERNIVRCDRIIDELLDYTRIRPLEVQPVILDVWLAEQLDDMEVPEGVEVVREFEAANTQIMIDSETLRRAVINLYDNAVQAMTKMEGAAQCDRRVLTVRTRRKQDNVDIVFADTGVGLADNADKVFEPMFSTKGFGVGLGLPTVRQIAEQHGGGVELSANTGAPGVCATLNLPL